MLHFLVVGGGPTGVEFAAELHGIVQIGYYFSSLNTLFQTDYFVDDLMKHYPKIVPDVRISLVQVISLKEALFKLFFFHSMEIIY